MLADSIAKLIEEMLESGGGQLELKRNEIESKKIDEALEKIISTKINNIEKKEEETEFIDLEEVYEEVYQRIERNLRLEKRRMGR